MLRKKYILFIVFLVIVIFFFTINCLLKFLPQTDIEIIHKEEVADLIYKELEHLPDVYKYPQAQGNHIYESIRNIGNQQFHAGTLRSLWKESNSWILSNTITNISSPNLGRILKALSTARITSADIDTRGTQLKLLLTLTGDQQIVFKPKWYNKEKIIEGPVYAGKDRYQSEIIGFYLSILLQKPLVPMSAERILSLKYDILPVATKRLLNTSFDRNNRTCIYGKCFYCKKEDPICDDENDKLTGAVIFNINKSFKSYRSPWQRTYKKGKQAEWEESNNYCQSLQTKLTKNRLLDLIDTSIFDFLIQNGDRHHYEILSDKVIWVDNGKGLGNPYIQFIDILAPLYQCCM